MISRGQNFKQIPLNIVGSSIFGRYPKISIEKTYNMFMSDNFMVPYAGYQLAVLSKALLNGKVGRGIFATSKSYLGSPKLVVVIDNNVFLVNIFFDQNTQKSSGTQITHIGQLSTSVGPVYIAENNKPQIAISDGTNIYIYDTTISPTIQAQSISFDPGYITFHDTYFICAATSDNFYSPPASNTWRLSAQNDGTSWPNTAANVGALQTKPDSIQAVVRFPSKGNMIFVMGNTVTESWFDTGNLLFPYTRNNQFNIDYGCLNPATVAYMDEFVVWLAQNEKSGPIIMYSDGGMPVKVTTDGIDYLFSQLQNPQDSQGFLYRQDGHLFYHINFYADNLSLVVDFTTNKIYHACDQNLNYFIAAQVAFFNNQYYFVSKNTGNIYAFDTIFTTYEDTDNADPHDIIENEIPRFRTCKQIRLPSQEYFVVNDVGFTIETGETNYQQQDIGAIELITEDGKIIITEGALVNLETENNLLIQAENGNDLISEQFDLTDFDILVSEQDEFIYSTPRVDLSISRDGGATFGSDFGYELNPIGQRKNKLLWWQIGAGNDVVCQFKFWGMGRFVVTDGIANIRQ